MQQVTAAQIQRMDDQALAAVLERALDPQIPVTLFYAVLDRLARPAPWYPLPAAASGGADRESVG